ncbi:hypothetical protein [Spirosoma sp. KNUC1025]|uniref:hypothetical protein n=1 Tax=Spirosoma sp. KNUC1025 TaxID=2894082 RepID=UPI0038662AB1|nr:hypothetical protein LN737_15870 [Spirosoma sp. KNUC1025]
MNDVVTVANQEFMNRFSKGAAGLGDLYTQDAMIMPPGGILFQGLPLSATSGKEPMN